MVATTPAPQERLIQEFAATSRSRRDTFVSTPYALRRESRGVASTTTARVRALANGQAATGAAAAVQEAVGSVSVSPAEVRTGKHSCPRFANYRHVDLSNKLSDEKYKTWHLEICVISNLLAPLAGEETISDQDTKDQRPCFCQRVGAAHAGNIYASRRTRVTRGVINLVGPAHLLTLLMIITATIREKMCDTSVDGSSKDIDNFKLRLGQSLPEDETVSLPISNVIGVYPDLVREQEMRLRRDECITWEEANEWQLLPGHAHQETGRQRGDRGSSGGQGMKRQVVSAIGNKSRGGRRSHDGSTDEDTLI
ncbi:hypothetical protein GN244_ATG12214 [Phytophthora infestans]|uniref:Uncharacterized protein n=1 Tax=Phytophthora infestans TaxID=4787 RepID=A0A833T094_PHYIN|nr:hypothetical protein GN244_ATG12214 [Phytophthora infestans]